MSDQIIRATHGSSDHPLQIGDLKIPCYVLEDGRRVLHQRGMVSSLDMSQGTGGSKGGDRLASFTAGKALQPYISGELRAVIETPIKFRTPRGAIAFGYEAIVLADICDAVLNARDQGRLQKQQEHIAKRCDVLMRGFARVGIIALVDEATGYQYERDRNALHQILEAYISKELLPWAKRFPDEFYVEMFRLRGWQYSPLSVAKPKFVGKITNEIVYQKLPPGVLEELREKNPIVDGRRKHKHHQFLTEDIGNPHLEKHLAVVIALMRASSTWKNFESLLARAFRKPNEAIQLPLLDDEEGN